MASRRLSKSVSAATKAHNAFSRPLLPRCRAISACAQFSSRSSPNSFFSRPNPFIGAGTRSQLLPFSLQFPSLRRFSDKSDQSDGEKGALETYGNDITEMAKQGKLHLLLGRDDEINRCIVILCRKTKCNPLIIGEPGIGQTAMAEGLAQRIVNGVVPQPLLNNKIISLDMGALLAGTQYRGEFEERLNAVLKEVTASNGKTILFIDEIHTLVDAGNSYVSNLLKPILGRGELRCIGATTLTEYRKYMEKDRALERRFQTVFCNQPSVEVTISILRGLKERYELHHGVKISDDSLVSAAVMANRYIPERFLPDKAIDLIDETASKLRVSTTSKPTELDEIDKAVIKLEMEKYSLKRDNANASTKLLQEMDNELTKLKDRQKEIIKQKEEEKSLITKLRSFKEEIDKSAGQNRTAELKYETLMSLQRKLEEAEKNLTSPGDSEQSLLQEEVTDLHIAETVSKWTGIPLSKLQQSYEEKVYSLAEVLHKRVVGQDMAVKAIVDALRHRLCLSESERPIHSFLFTGPTGVGKTELANALAGHIFNNENAVVRIDMSEYMEKNSVSRLIGAPPGCAGFEEGGLLTEAIRRRPYSVILFDHIEKAHPDVSNIFLQILKDRRITDYRRRTTVSFRNCFVIMTANIGSHRIVETSDDNKDNKEGVITWLQAMDLVSKTFKAEFVGKINQHVFFQPLDLELLPKIVEFQIRRVKNLLEQKKIKLEYTKEAVDLLAQLGFDPNNGASTVKRVIQEIVKKEISSKLLKGEFTEEDTILLEVDQPNNKLVIKKLESSGPVEELAAA